MESIKDCLGRIACKVDPRTGLVECLYKGNRTSTVLSVGETFVIERENIVTEVTRTKNNKFHVTSHRMAA